MPALLENGMLDIALALKDPNILALYMVASRTARDHARSTRASALISYSMCVANNPKPV